MEETEAYSLDILKKAIVDLDTRKRQALATYGRASKKELQAIQKEHRAIAKHLDYINLGIKSE